MVQYSNDTVVVKAVEEKESKYLGLGLVLLPVACLACLVAVYMSTLGTIVLINGYLIQFIILTIAYLIVCILLLTLNESETRKYLGALIATGTVLPVALVMTTVVIYFVGWGNLTPSEHEGRYSLFWGSVIAVWGWFVAAFVCRRFADFENAIPSSYGEFEQRLSQLKSALKALCPNVTCDSNNIVQCNNPSEAIARNEIQFQIEAIEKSLKIPGLLWVLATGYINVWGQLYSAEEAMIEILPHDKVIAGAVYDELRLDGSDIKQRDELISKSRQAVCIIDPGAKHFLKASTTATLPLVIITPSQLPAHPVNTDYLLMFQATGGTPPYKWSVTGEAKAKELKDGGLKLDESTGVLSGKTPQKPYDFFFEISVIDSIGLTLKKCFSLAIKEAVAVATLPSLNAILNTEARAVLRTVRSSINEYREGRWNGLILARNRLMATMFFTSLTVYILLIIALLGNADKGSVFAASVFYVVGAAMGLGSRLLSEQENKSGVYDYGLSAAGLITVPIFSGLTAIGGAFLIAMLPFAGQILGPLQSAPLTISTAAQLREGTVAKPYYEQLTATGGTEPYKWTIRTDGKVATPDALELNEMGVVSGTPTNKGSGRFIVQVSDSTGRMAAKMFVLTINPSPAKATKLAIDTTSPLPAAISGKGYCEKLQAIGGKPPYKWKVSKEQMKGSGLDIDENTGELKGIPKGSKTFTLNVQVTDANKQTDKKTLSLSVKEPEEFSRTTASVGAGTGGTIPSLNDIYSLRKNLGGILVAAIFGLTPGLLFDRLRQLTNKYKEELKSSQTTQGKELT